MDLLATSCEGSANLETLHILSGYPKATVKRILDDMQELGLVYRRLADKRYVLLNMDQATFDPINILVKDLSPVLQHLHQSTGLFSDFVMLRQGQPSIIESNFSLSNLRSTADRVIGARPSLRESAAGRTLYAETNACPELDKIHEHWADTLQQEKSRGVYQRIEGSWEYGFDKPFDIRAIALPVRFKGETIAALSLYWNGRIQQQAGNNHEQVRLLAGARDKMEEIIADRAMLYRRLALELPFD